MKVQFNSDVLAAKELSNILTLIIAFQQRIEDNKIKLCSFSNFSIEKCFKLLDKQQKGSITIQDIYTQIQGKVQQKYIYPIIERMNGQGSNKNMLSYFGFINLVKPYFQTFLAKQIISRDNISKKMNTYSFSIHPNRDYEEKKEQFISQINAVNTVRSILKQLIFLYCIFSCQHQKMKQSILQQYQLSPYQIIKLIQNKNSNEYNPANNFKKIYNFLENNSIYTTEQSQIKILMAYCRCNQYLLLSEKHISLIFMPFVNTSIAYTQHLNPSTINFRESNISTHTPILSFLNYVHPKSLPRIQQKKEISNSPYKDSQSVVHQQISNRKGVTFQSPRPYIIYQQNEQQQHKSSRTNLQFTILQKFMKPQNIIKNMSHNQKMYQPHSNDLLFHNKIDNIDESSAFEIANYQYDNTINEQYNQRDQIQYIIKNKLVIDKVTPKKQEKSIFTHSKHLNQNKIPNLFREEQDKSQFLNNFLLK